jgi:calcium-dependent protein kinase
MGCISSKGKGVRPVIISTASDLKIHASNFVVQRGGTIRDDYHIGQKLGEGSYGYVRLATNKTSGQKRAIKTVKKATITKDLKERARFVAEIDILKRMDHPNIVRLYEFYEDDHNYHLVTEYLQGGELFDFIIKSKLLSEPLAASLMRQLLGAVAYCHANNIVHRDLKPENLLLDNNKSQQASLKVIDFGTSGLIEANKKMKQRYGTSYYIAPEVISGNYNEKCDEWSCGVILFILLCGKPPFFGKTDEDILRRVRVGEYSFEGPDWASVSEDAKDLIRKLLNKNVDARITAAEAVQDRWIVDNSHRSPEEAEIRETTFGQLQAFRAESKLQKAVMSFIASQLVNKEESQKLAEAFRELDKNGDGRLSRDELLTGYAALGVGAVAEVERIMREVDSDGSGFIDYSEFIMATLQQETMLNRGNLEAAFNAFDQDRSGKISMDELKALLGAEIETKNAIWEELIRGADLDGDGQIDLNEFQQMMVRMYS